MKITPLIAALALVFGLLASLTCWTWTVTHDFVMSDPWWKSLLLGLFQTFSNPELRQVAMSSLLKGFIPVFIILYVLNEFDDSTRLGRVMRGTRVVSSSALSRKTRAKPHQEQIEIAGVPIPLECESAHILLAGSTGSGKTTAADELLHFAVKRGDRMIVVDPNGHALSKFGKNGDVVLNPFDKRSPGWSIFNEMRKPYDVERFAKSVIPDSADASSQQWHGYAQQLFAEVMRALTQNGDMTTERLLFWLTQASSSELKDLLVGSAAGGLFEPGADKALASTRFILSHHVSAFQYLKPGKFSLRTWLEKGEGNLFITWREDMLTTLGPLVGTWVDILIASVLTLPDDKPRPLWLVLDELAGLKRLNSLESGLTRARKHGLRIVGGLQAISQLDFLYGEHGAKTLLSCFGNLLALRCSNADPKTAKDVSEGLGTCDMERVQTTQGDSKAGRSRSTSRQRTHELSVLASELTTLPPLHGFLKFAGDYPIGKIRLIPKNFVTRVIPFEER